MLPATVGLGYRAERTGSPGAGPTTTVPEARG